MCESYNLYSTLYSILLYLSAAGLPRLIGALVFGLAYRLMFSPPPSALCSPIRALALSALLLRAGFNIHLPTLLNNKASTLALSLVPFLVEAAAVAGMASFLISPPVALMIGALISDVSPAGEKERTMFTAYEVQLRK